MLLIYFHSFVIHYRSISSLVMYVDLVILLILLMIVTSLVITLNDNLVPRPCRLFWFRLGLPRRIEGLFRGTLASLFRRRAFHRGLRVSSEDHKSIIDVFDKTREYVNVEWHPFISLYTLYDISWSQRGRGKKLTIMEQRPKNWIWETIIVTICNFIRDKDRFTRVIFHQPSWHFFAFCFRDVDACLYSHVPEGRPGYDDYLSDRLSLMMMML